jgi:hypothetical protein
MLLPLGKHNRLLKPAISLNSIQDQIEHHDIALKSPHHLGKIKKVVDLNQQKNLHFDIPHIPSLILKVEDILNVQQGHHFYVKAMNSLKNDDYEAVRVKELFEEAAKVGHAEAAFNAGICNDPTSEFTLENGLLGNREKTMVLYRQAASKGHARAQFRLGMLLLSAVSKNTLDIFNEAVDWLKMSSALGHKEACSVLSLINYK